MRNLGIDVREMRSTGVARDVLSLGGGLAQTALMAVGIVTTLTACFVDLPYFVFMSLACIAVFSLAAAVLRLPTRPGSSLMKAYFVLLAMFHFGLVPVYLLVWEGADAHRLLPWWVLDEYLTRAALKACLTFTAAFATMAIVSQARMGNARSVSDLTLSRRPMLYEVSLVALIGLIGLWFVLVLGIMRPTNYIDYYVQAERTGLGTVTGLMDAAIAASLFLACLSARSLWAPLLIYGVWASVAFPFGLRGPVLFPLALVLPLLVGQGRLRVPLWVTMVAAACVLVLAGSVGQSRIGGDARGISPLTTIAELGGSLRPNYEVERWFYQGDQPRLGATYWAPFERTFLGLVPVAERLPGTEDERLANVLIMKRAGPFGFSIIAESVLNFGILGAAAIGALAGIFLSGAARNMALDRMVIWNAALFFGFLVHIRQSFVTFFGATFVFLACTLSLVILARLLGMFRR